MNTQKLQTHAWFKATSPELQKELLSLPEDFTGFVDDLADRNDEIGELDVLKLIDLKKGNFLITPIFEVRSSATNQVFSYEYVSWRSGSRTGTRGIIFLETNGEITHFLVSKTFKFSVAKEVYDSIGGLYVSFHHQEAQNLPKKLEQEICFHLGLDKLEFKKVVDLGLVHPDLGMTNNTSGLFAAIIDISHLPEITTQKDLRLSHKPVGLSLEIVHISEFVSYLNKIQDNYFLSAAARVLVHPDFSLPL